MGTGAAKQKPGGAGCSPAGAAASPARPPRPAASSGAGWRSDTDPSPRRHTSGGPGGGGGAARRGASLTPERRGAVRVVEPKGRRGAGARGAATMPQARPVFCCASDSFGGLNPVHAWAHLLHAQACLPSLPFAAALRAMRRRAGSPVTARKQCLHRGPCRLCISRLRACKTRARA